MSALHVQVPLRISFGGGGTDVDTYYAAHGGVVVSTAIATYCHVSVGRMESGVEVTATDYDATVRCSRAAELPLEAPFLLAHAALTELWPAEAGGIRVTLGADVAPGSGMGTSCALVVALCAALGALLGKELSGAALAELAYRVDHEVAGLPSGKQDHYAAACGGLNVIEFRGDGVTVTPVGLREPLLRELEARTLLFFDGSTRAAAKVLVGQRASALTAGPVLEALHDVKAIALRMIDALRAGDLDTFSRLLGESWEHKKRFSPHVSTAKIDAAIERALGAGALGAKIAGAGAGGHLLVMAAAATQGAIRESLADAGWAAVPVRFDAHGPTLTWSEE